MELDLTQEEKRLVEYSQEAIVKYNKIRHANGGIDTLYDFVLSNQGEIYDGASYEPNIAHANVCGERCAIANMVLQESYLAKIKSIVVADPVPEVQEHGTPPCGTCRHLIWSHGTPKTTVLLLQYIQDKEGWIFPTWEKYTIRDLYPFPYEPKEGLWNNWQPKELSHRTVAQHSLLERLPLSGVRDVHSIPRKSASCCPSHHPHQSVPRRVTQVVGR